LVAVAFQEFAPYPDAFIATPESTLYQCDKAIRHTLNNWTTTDTTVHKKQQSHSSNSNSNTRSEQHERYEQIAVHTLVGMALLVYARRETLFVVSATSVNDVGCGVGWAGNKGAVGVYCRLTWHSTVSNHTTFEEQKQEQEEETTTSIEMAFINAHLMAHADQLERRHQELQMIMERLLFDVKEESNNNIIINSSQQVAVSSSFPTTTTSTIRILDLPIVFLMGDLNYRITPQGGAISDNVAWSYDVTERVKFAALHRASNPFPINNDDVETLSHLRYTCDQLTVARRQDRQHVLARFNEPECKFLPTYKFILNSDQYAFTQRTPSWCDRIFYYVYGGDTASTIITNLWYDACFDYHQSDHRPVAAMFLIDTSHLNRIGYQAELAAQASHTPSMIDTTRHPQRHRDLLREIDLHIIQPDPWWRWKRQIGRVTTQCFGRTWWLFTSGWWWRIALTSLLATLFSVYYLRN
jgi:hypothetical protein